MGRRRVRPRPSAVWRILRACGARAASTRGVRLSMSSSAIGALMLSRVPGYGPESVNAGVLGGLWAGFNAGSKVFGETLPAPARHEWLRPAGQPRLQRCSPPALGAAGARRPPSHALPRHA